MVELSINPTALNALNKVVASSREDLKQASDRFESEQINLTLVAEARKRLRREIRSDDRMDGFYSLYHYEEIMHQDPAFVCWRYLLHCQKRVESAVKLMKEALVWRHDNVDTIKPSEMAKEFWHYTPIVSCGEDKLQNSVVYIVGKNYRKPDQALRETIRRFTLSIFFDWDKLHRMSLKKMTVVFDVNDTGYQNIDLDFMSWLVSIRDFLPARLANIYVIGIPLLMRPIVKLIISWLPENYSKIVHCGTYQELVKANIDDDELATEVGGSRATDQNRLAPIEAPWLRDSRFRDPMIRRAIDWTIGFSVDNGTREERKHRQQEYESQINQIQCGNQNSNH